MASLPGFLWASRRAAMQIISYVQISCQYRFARQICKSDIVGIVRCKQFSVTSTKPPYFNLSRSVLGHMAGFVAADIPFCR